MSDTTSSSTCLSSSLFFPPPPPLLLLLLLLLLLSLLSFDSTLSRTAYHGIAFASLVVSASSVPSGRTLAVDLDRHDFLVLFFVVVVGSFAERPACLCCFFRSGTPASWTPTKSTSASRSVSPCRADDGPGAADTSSIKSFGDGIDRCKFHVTPTTRLGRGVIRGIAWWQWIFGGDVAFPRIGNASCAAPFATSSSIVLAELVRVHSPSPPLVSYADDDSVLEDGAATSGRGLPGNMGVCGDAGICFPGCMASPDAAFDIIDAFVRSGGNVAVDFPCRLDARIVDARATLCFSSPALPLLTRRTSCPPPLPFSSLCTSTFCPDFLISSIDITASPHSLPTQYTPFTPHHHHHTTHTPLSHHTHFF